MSGDDFPRGGGGNERIDHGHRSRTGAGPRQGTFGSVFLAHDRRAQARPGPSLASLLTGLSWLTLLFPIRNGA